MRRKESAIAPVSERKQQLIQFAKGEAESFSAREINRLSSTAELSEQFGYRPTTVKSYLRATGVAKQRRLARVERRGEVFNSDRAQDLVDAAREELLDFQTGRTSQLSSYVDLSERFGYKYKTGARVLLQRSGLAEKRKSAEREIKQDLTPSEELAWMLGILSAGGVVAKTGEISLSCEHEGPLSQFRLYGEGLFQINAATRMTYKKARGKILERPTVSFYDLERARSLGDLRRSQWPETLVSQHKWLLDQQKYLWKFVEGFFEEKGSVTVRRENTIGEIILSTSSIEAAFFLTDLLVSLGLNRPTVGRAKQGTIITGVRLQNLEDIRAFSNNVHSTIQKKEDALDYYRNRESRRGKTVKYKTDDVIAEWKRITQLVGHSPTITEINKLRRQGDTSYSTNMYAKRFGEKSFVKARENLERIIAEQEQSQGEDSSPQEGQIFP
ncbi:MAG: hypothetical protein HYV40_03045 [Candidatus Levybacteria bacterium]|nr:hypothetical protein [Candidatus Levybacteria bacterium]